MFSTDVFELWKRRLWETPTVWDPTSSPEAETSPGAPCALSAKLETPALATRKRADSLADLDSQGDGGRVRRDGQRIEMVDILNKRVIWVGVKSRSRCTDSALQFHGITKNQIWSSWRKWICSNWTWTMHHSVARLVTEAPVTPSSRVKKIWLFSTNTFLALSCIVYPLIASPTFSLPWGWHPLENGQSLPNLPLVLPWNHGQPRIMMITACTVPIYQ